MATYYRKLEKGEDLKDGDRAFIDGAYRPVIITDGFYEAPPEPPAHRVEDETWHFRPEGGLVANGAENAPAQIVCNEPPGWATGSLKDWPQRAKRICAGQEALKLLAKYRLFTSKGGGYYVAFEPECDRILSMLKEDK